VLSIIVPTLNEQETIAVNLAGLQTLRRRGVEVIVVDGGSEDNSVRLAAPLCDRVIVARRGRASQMNAGAQRSTGEQLLFLHSDTALPEGALEAINQALMTPGCVWGRFDVKIDSPLRLLIGVAFMMNLRSRWTGIATGDQAIFVKRAAFERIGGFPAVSLMEDIALSKSLKHLSPPACLRTKVTTSGRRWEKSGIIRTVLLMWRLRLAYFLGADPSRLAEQYAHARRDA
jgi:rSAM/selenodomain-associated transferase 2